MDNPERYLLGAAICAAIALAIIVWRHVKKRRRLNQRERFIYETLELAKNQYEIFNVKMRQTEIARPGLSLLLRAADADGLRMETSDYVAPDWEGRPTEVFFKTLRDDVPVFYVFYSRVTRLKSDHETSWLLLQTPDHIRVEKKRHFTRVRPPGKSVLALALWPLAPGKRLPARGADLGAPVASGAEGKGDLFLENVSGAGVGFRVKGESAESLGKKFMKGSQLIAMIKYVAPGDEERIFWFTGEVMNARLAETEAPELSLGVEFTNQALESPGEEDLRWSHCSPSRGVRSILQWIEKIDSDQRKTA